MASNIQKFKPIRYLAGSGGGLKGLAFIECIRFFEERGLLDICEYAATSISSVIFTLHNCGYCGKELRHIFLTTDFKQFKNIKMSNLSEFFGFDSGNNFIKWLNMLIVSKLGYEYERVTFIELYNLTQKKLNIVGTNLSTHTAVYYNHQTTPNVSILDAVRISFSVPIILTSVKYNGQIYVDGGVLDNFAIHLFNDKPLNEVLAIKVAKRQEAEYQMPTFESFISNLMQCMYYDLENRKIIPKYEGRTIHVHAYDFPIIDYNISAVDREKLFDIGFASAQEWFNNHQNKGNDITEIVDAYREQLHTIYTQISNIPGMQSYSQQLSNLILDMTTHSVNTPSDTTSLENTPSDNTTPDTPSENTPSDNTTVDQATSNPIDKPQDSVNNPTDDTVPNDILTLQSLDNIPPPTMPPPQPPTIP